MLYHKELADARILIPDFEIMMTKHQHPQSFQKIYFLT
jgi:hypothetical protein